MPKGGLPKHHPDHDPGEAFQILPIEQPEEMARILAFLPKCRDRAAAEKDLLTTSYWLSKLLHERAGKNRKILQAELKSFDRRLSKRAPTSVAEVEAMLCEISGTARKCVEAVARRHLRGRMKMPPAELLACALEPSRDNPNRNAAGLAPRIKLHAWVRMAAVKQLPKMTWETIKPHSTLGPEVLDDLSPVYEGKELVPVKRPADNALREAVRSLARIWHKQCGTKPTLIVTTENSLDKSVQPGTRYGPFLNFCRAVIAPVYLAQGLKIPMVHSTVQDCLHKPKKHRYEGGGDGS
jgi:hypothetical protein